VRRIGVRESTLEESVNPPERDLLTRRPTDASRRMSDRKVAQHLT